MIDYYGKLYDDLETLYSKSWSLETLEMYNTDRETWEKVHEIGNVIEAAMMHILNTKTWYAVLMDDEDNDLSCGSFVYEEAVEMAIHDGCKLIAHCKNGEVIETEAVEA